jgi:protoporphyrinogen oxidase
LPEQRPPLWQARVAGADGRIFNAIRFTLFILFFPLFISSMEHHPVVIIGAGIAGLTCAKYLNDHQIPSTVLEASDAVGGRVRTDEVDGFRLDRGFQVLLTSYPEARALLDYEALDLKAFRSGALIRYDQSFVKLANPLKEPLAAIPTLFAPVASLSDKLKVLKISQQIRNTTEEQFFDQPDTSTLEFLQSYGWSEEFIQNFFRPFFGGVFLERELSTSSNFFQFLFQQFALSDVVVPATGMQAIPEQLAARLPAGSIQTNRRVNVIREGKIHLETGEILSPEITVLAVDASASDHILRCQSSYRFNETACVYFAANRSPLKDTMLVINPDDSSLINNMCVPSDIAPAYAPAGKSLISVSVVGKGRIPHETDLAGEIQKELTGWFGNEVKEWQHLRTYYIPQALPQYLPYTDRKPSLRLNSHFYRCGDHLAYPSLNAAMKTGREVAQMIIRHKQNH